MNTFQIAENLAEILGQKTGSVLGATKDFTMTAEEQRAAFGGYIFGKRRLVINGEDETVTAKRMVCFGSDWEWITYKWSEIENLVSETKLAKARKAAYMEARASKKYPNLF